jgi:cation diffusion facilitator family transporter
VLQLIIVALSGSVALLADTAHNFADALTSVPLWLAFAIGARAATRRYTFGYGRLEDVAGVFIVLMIVSSGVLIVVASVQRLFDPPEVEALPLVMAAGVIGFLGNEAVAIYRTRVGREIGSAALVADGQHARADGLTSLGVLAGAIGVAAGAPIADPLVGLLIGVAILGLAWGSGVEVWYRLTDGVEPALVDELTAVVSVVEGVESVGQVRLRWTGHRLHAEVTARVHGDMPLSASHQIAEDVRHATLHARPELADSVVHVDPCEHFGLDDAHRQTEHHFGGA